MLQMLDIPSSPLGLFVELAPRGQSWRQAFPKQASQRTPFSRPIYLSLLFASLRFRQTHKASKKETIRIRVHLHMSLRSPAHGRDSSCDVRGL